MIAAVDILLGYIVKWNVAVVIFQVIETPLCPSLKILRFMAVGAGITCAGFVAGVAICGS